MLLHKQNAVSNELALVRTFDKHYINLVEKSCGKKPINVIHEYGNVNGGKALCLVCKVFENHDSIKEIKENLRESAPTTQNKTKKFSLSEHMEKILRNVDPKNLQLYSKFQLNYSHCQQRS